MAARKKSRQKSRKKGKNHSLPKKFDIVFHDTDYPDLLDRKSLKKYTDDRQKPYQELQKELHKEEAKKLAGIIDGLVEVDIGELMEEAERRKLKERIAIDRLAATIAAIDERAREEAFARDPDNIIYGIGIFDDVKKAIKTVTDTGSKAIKSVFKLRDNKFPPKVRSLIEEYGNDPITSITVSREPVQSYVRKLLDAVSLGTFSSAVKESAYDDVYHLSMTVEVNHDGRKVPIFVEKNEVVNMKANHTPKKEAYLSVPVTKSLTFGQLIDNAISKVGNNIYLYDHENNNCQHFIADLLRSSGLLTSDANKFIVQDVESILKKTPSYVGSIARFATDTAARTNRFLEGEGKRLEDILQDHKNNCSSGHQRLQKTMPPVAFNELGHMTHGITAYAGPPNMQSSKRFKPAESLTRRKMEGGSPLAALEAGSKALDSVSNAASSIGNAVDQGRKTTHELNESLGINDISRTLNPAQLKAKVDAEYRKQQHERWWKYGDYQPKYLDLKKRGITQRQVEQFDGKFGGKKALPPGVEDKIDKANDDLMAYILKVLHLDQEYNKVGSGESNSPESKLRRAYMQKLFNVMQERRYGMGDEFPFPKLRLSRFGLNHVSDLADAAKHHLLNKADDALTKFILKRHGEGPYSRKHMNGMGEKHVFRGHGDLWYYDGDYDQEQLKKWYPNPDIAQNFW